MSNLPEMLTAAELSEILGCAVSTVEDRARRGDLPGLKFGDGGWVFPSRATIEVLNHMAVARMQESRQGQVRENALVSLASKRVGPPALPSL